MFRMKTHFSFLYISCTLLALVLMLSACNVPASVPSQNPVAVPTDPMPNDPPTQAPVEDPDQDSIAVTVNVEGVAQDFTSQVIAVVPSSTNGPWWEAMPQYTLLTLQGYPITSHLLKAQIFVYPVAGLGVNEAASGVAGSLQALLGSQQAGDNMPYLPLYNAAQIIHTQVEYLDFKNGRGVRYLTQFDQGILPINNYELHYTFQGLTSDGKYYVAAVLPVNLPGLPADGIVDLNNPPTNLLEDFPTYMSDTVDMLSGQPASAFTPDLSGLDAMIASLEIK